MESELVAAPYGAGMSVAFPDPILADSSATVSCAVEYTRTGPPAYACKADGAWNATFASECQPILCPNLTAPTGGNLSRPNPPMANQVVQLVCGPEFELTLPSPALLCQLDGAWNQSLTADACKRIGWLWSCL